MPSVTQESTSESDDILIEQPIISTSSENATAPSAVPTGGDNTRAPDDIPPADYIFHDAQDLTPGEDIVEGDRALGALSSDTHTENVHLADSQNIPTAEAGSGVSSTTEEHESDVFSDEELAKYDQAESSNLDADLQGNNSLL